MNIHFYSCFRCQRQVNDKDIETCRHCERNYCSNCWIIPSHREGTHNHTTTPRQQEVLA